MYVQNTIAARLFRGVLIFVAIVANQFELSQAFPSTRAYEREVKNMPQKKQHGLDLVQGEYEV